MINRVVFFSLLLIIVASCNKSVSDSFVLEGSIEGGKTLDSIYLNYYSLQNNEWYEICDTAKIIDGKFIFKGKLEGLTLAYLNFDSKGIELYIEPCTMKLNIDAKQPYTYGLSGTEVDKENEEIKKAVGSYERLMDEKSNVMIDLINEFNRINQMQLPDNSSIIDSLLNIIHNNSAEMSLLNKEKHRVYVDFASKHKSYKISPALLYRASKFDFVGKDTILSVYNSLPENLKTSLMGKLAYRQILQQGKTVSALVGDIAPDFVKKDSLGNMVRLSDFRGKSYVLLDFWASWCAPCIKEIPKLKDIHTDYSREQLQIIGISSDENRNNWLRAIDKYNLNEWPQILAATNSDGRLFDEDLSDNYNVEYLPTLILIDKQGKIVARWVNIGDEQEAVLRELLKF